MTLSDVLAMLDTIESSYRSAEADARAAALSGLSAQLLATGDYDFATAFKISLAQLPKVTSADFENKNAYQALFADLDQYLKVNMKALLLGGKPVTALDQYLSYQNAAIRDSALVGPKTARLNWLYRNSLPPGLLAPGNVYAPLTQFGAATVGAGAAITYNDQASIATANAGNVQGYTASKGLRAHVTTAVNGTLAVVVTGSGRDSTGAAVVGRTWAAVLDNHAVGTDVDFTPSHAGDRISHITSVAGAGSATAGAFTLSSILER